MNRAAEESRRGRTGARTNWRAGEWRAGELERGRTARRQILRGRLVARVDRGSIPEGESHQGRAAPWM
eukprot:3685661-Lingulodinium_polyedra.AAC.1